MDRSSPRCRSCDQGGLVSVLDLGRMPLANALLSAGQLDFPEPAFPLDDVRERLATRVLELGGAARVAEERAAVLATLSRTAWVEAWEQAVRQAADRVAQGIDHALVAEDRPVSPEELIRALRYAWEQTEIVRIRLLREMPQQRQLSAPWEHSGEQI